MTYSRHFNSIAFLFVVALVTAMLTIRARSDAEWQALVAATAGEDVITFRTKPDERFFFPEWTPEHVTAVRALAGADEAFWRGGYTLAQGPASAYVLPVVVASPGFLTARNTTFVAGRDLDEEDAGRPRLVLSEAHAQVIFPELTPHEVVGQHVRVLDERLEVVGVAAGADAAYRTARTPPRRFGEEYDVQAVYLRLSDKGALSEAVRRINAYLADTPALSGLEAVPYREFVRPGVVDERLDYVREVSGLFSWMVTFAVVLAVINLANQALLAAAKKRQTWALHRVLGASRWQLVGLELVQSARLEGLAVFLGALLGLFVGAYLGGLATAQAALLGIGVGLGSLVLGSLPLVWEVLKLYPYRALRQSRGLERHGVLGVTGAVGLLLALALVVLAGGFRDLGHMVIGAEVEAIGADLVELAPDRSSILPVARLTESDVDVLRQAYPGVPMTLVERHQAQLQRGERAFSADVLAADEAFIAVSGTRLAAGEARADGLVLGHAVAESLFPAGDAIGQTLTLSGPRLGQLELEVAAVAAPPSTERLEALQLRPEAVYVPRALLSASALSARLYVRAAGLSSADLEALSARLRERHPDAAPFIPRYVPATYQNYLDRLNEQSRQFNLAAALTLALATVGLGTLAAVRAAARLYVRGLERTFGAKRAEVFRSELASVVKLALLVGGLGAALGLVAFWTWTRAAGYPFAIPHLWLAAALGVALGIGLAVGTAVARHVAEQPPIAILRGET
jgi:putative ABC transport system permease protein